MNNQQKSPPWGRWAIN